MKPTSAREVLKVITERMKSLEKVEGRTALGTGGLMAYRECIELLEPLAYLEEHEWVECPYCGHVNTAKDLGLSGLNLIRQERDLYGDHQCIECQKMFRWEYDMSWELLAQPVE